MDPAIGKKGSLQWVSENALPLLRVAAKGFSKCAYSPFMRAVGQQFGCYDIEGDACCKDVLEDAKPSIKRCETVLLMLQIVDHLLDETDRTQVRNRYFCFGVDHTLLIRPCSKNFEYVF